MKLLIRDRKRVDGMLGKNKEGEMRVPKESRFGNLY